MYKVLASEKENENDLIFNFSHAAVIQSWMAVSLMWFEFFMKKSSCSQITTTLEFDSKTALNLSDKDQENEWLKYLKNY